MGGGGEAAGRRRWCVLYALGEADLRMRDRREAGCYREETVVAFESLVAPGFEG